MLKTPLSGVGAFLLSRQGSRGGGDGTLCRDGIRVQWGTHHDPFGIKKKTYMGTMGQPSPTMVVAAAALEHEVVDDAREDQDRVREDGRGEQADHDPVGDPSRGGARASR